MNLSEQLYQQLPPVPSIETIDRLLAQKSLRHFIEQAWHVLEPANPFVPGWHIDAICEHLEAITRREINKLIINIPPRHAKSLIVSVFWPMWQWINAPYERFIYASYAQVLSTRDSLKCRRLIQSEWYQERWADRFQLTGDQNQKMRFDNDKMGYRIATSVGGVATGEGGSCICGDDLHNVIEGESDKKRVAVLIWWDESMSTRLDNPDTGAKVLVMQRIHEEDVSGHALASERGYIHLCLPARYEGNRVKTVIPLGNPFEDPRTIEGEPLWPARYNDNILTELEQELSAFGGEYAVAGQLQQRPVSRKGGMFLVDNFQKAQTFNTDKIKKSIRYWDKAATEGGGAYTCGVLMHLLSDNRLVIEDVTKGQWATHKREDKIKECVISDNQSYPDVKTWMEEEGGSGGKDSARFTIRNNAGYNVYAEHVSGKGSKEIRAEPYSVQVNNGNVTLIEAPWNKSFIDNHRLFPRGKFKDDIDAASGAFNQLFPRKPKKRVGVW